MKNLNIEFEDVGALRIEEIKEIFNGERLPNLYKMIDELADSCTLQKI